MFNERRLATEAHDYVDNHLPPDAPEAPKVMILARVVLGRPIALTTNGYYLQSPPGGYDSVRRFTFISVYKIAQTL